MGGQACILYGAAEFNRDIDVAVLASTDNLRHLHRALGWGHNFNFHVLASRPAW
jgi:hypothetical protein